MTEKNTTSDNNGNSNGVKNNHKNKIRSEAFLFIVLMGIVSMFSDMTHESATSIMGAYLTLAGASAGAIGFVAGLGEGVGYSLRLISGYWADQTHHYWPLTMAGYIVDCVAIPLLALVPEGGWIWACVLIVIQRIGKAVKKPAKDTLLSFAATQTGVGKSFALQEFLDQLGAFLGPVLLFLVMYFRPAGQGDFSRYSFCFALLGIPAVLTIVMLFVARRRFPDPENFEPPASKNAPPFKMNRSFIFYIVAICLFAAGFMDFPLITMHVLCRGLLPEAQLPLLYAGAMAVDAFAALLFGWLFDKVGLKVLLLSTILAAPFGIFIFLNGGQGALFIGVTLWGIGMGAQESILKAAVTEIVPKQNRSSGFGIFQTAFGIAWFLGSWLMGSLYDVSLPIMVTFSVVIQLAALPFYWQADRGLRRTV